MSHNAHTPDPNPDQEDITQIIKLLTEIKDMLTDFINNDYKRLCANLVARGIVDKNYFDEYKNNHVPLIRQRMNDAIGYIEAHRYDPGFKNSVRNNGFFRPEGNTKKSRFNKFGIWLVDKIKKKPIKFALKCAEVLLEEMDTILESLAGFVPGLEAVIEIKKHG
jgi:hypothetical protein